jgi:hypothetical protein
MDGNGVDTDKTESIKLTSLLIPRTQNPVIPRAYHF